MTPEETARVQTLERSAESAMGVIDAEKVDGAVGNRVRFRLYVSPKGRYYVTVVGLKGDRGAFAEVLAPASDATGWNDVISAVVKLEETGR